MAGSQWYYVKGGKQQGPVSSKELRKLVKQRMIGPTHLVWKKGLDDWIPITKVKGVFQSAPEVEVSPTPRPDQPQRKSESSLHFLKQLSVAVEEGHQLPNVSESSLTEAEDEDDEFSSDSEPIKVTIPGSKKRAKRPGSSETLDRSRRSIVGAEAGIFIRLIPAMVDAFICRLMALVIMLVYIPLLKAIAPDFAKEIPRRGADFSTFQTFVTVSPIAVAFLLYFVLFECSSWQRTPGKALLGLKVTDGNGEPITFGASFLRTLTKFGPVIIVSFIFGDRTVTNLASLGCLLAWFLAGVTVQKQALHDLIAGTVVIRESFVREPSSIYDGVDYRYLQNSEEPVDRDSVRSRRRKKKRTSLESYAAGFWIRTVSLIIDLLISAIIMGTTSVGIYYALRDHFPEAFIQMRFGGFFSTPMSFLIVLPGFILTLAYFWLMESSESGATLGKSACTLKVVDSQGEPISSLQSALRQFAKIAPIFFVTFAIGSTFPLFLPLGWLVVILSFLIAGFTPKKQAIHDVLAGTYVVEDR